MADIPLSRLNAPMPLYRDCTVGELIVLYVATLIVCLITIMTLTGVFLSMLMLGVVIAVPVSFMLMPIATRVSQVNKVGKPLGYYQQRVQLGLEGKGILQSGFVRRVGHWSVLS